MRAGCVGRENQSATPTILRRESLQLSHCMWLCNPDLPSATLAMPSVCGARRANNGRYKADADWTSGKRATNREGEHKQRKELGLGARSLARTTVSIQKTDCEYERKDASMLRLGTRECFGLGSEVRLLVLSSYISAIVLLVSVRLVSGSKLR